MSESEHETLSTETVKALIIHNVLIMATSSDNAKAFPYRSGRPSIDTRQEGGKSWESELNIPLLGTDAIRVEFKRCEDGRSICNCERFRAIRMMDTIARIVICDPGHEVAAVGLAYKCPVVKIVLLKNNNTNQKATVIFLEELWSLLQRCAKVSEALRRGRGSLTQAEAAGRAEVAVILQEITRIILKHGWDNVRNKLEKRLSPFVNTASEIRRMREGEKPKRIQYQPKEVLADEDAYVIIQSIGWRLLDLQIFYRQDRNELTEDDIQEVTRILLSVNRQRRVLHSSAAFKAWADKEYFQYFQYFKEVTDVYVDISRLHEAACSPRYHDSLRKPCKIICVTPNSSDSESEPDGTCSNCELSAEKRQKAKQEGCEKLAQAQPLSSDEETEQTLPSREQWTSVERSRYQSEKLEEAKQERERTPSKKLRDSRP